MKIATAVSMLMTLTVIITKMAANILFVRPAVKWIPLKTLFMKKFEFNRDGCSRAIEYLNATGKLDQYNTSGFSADGFSLVEAANQEASKVDNIIHDLAVRNDKK